ncbi:hypothetical protein [Albimonas pacifica]|uniref:Uncharacterized protein n=1 Tax=Albimonas pacifica TaxID=1114924 RepID=A0A1I3E0Y7_9RHOB|nr:hypothetical protein [Albimonas pacifica]SFH92563.1 hypothetical protein SAMN05216258_103120 [Albimonas pacifica]
MRNLPRPTRRQALAGAVALGAILAAAAVLDRDGEGVAQRRALASPEVREAAELSTEEIARRLEASVQQWAPAGTVALDACRLVRGQNPMPERCDDGEHGVLTSALRIDAGWLVPGAVGARIVQRGDADQVIVPYRPEVEKRARAVERRWDPEAAAIIAATPNKADLPERLQRLQRRWRELFPAGVDDVPTQRVVYCSGVEGVSVDGSTDRFNLIVGPGEGEAARTLLAELSWRCAPD